MSNNTEHDKNQHDIAQRTADLAYKQVKNAVLIGGPAALAGFAGGAGLAATLGAPAKDVFFLGGVGGITGGFGGAVFSNLPTLKESKELEFDTQRLQSGIMYDEIYSKLPAGLLSPALPPSPHHYQRGKIITAETSC